jgi:hypothetical protein
MESDRGKNCFLRAISTRRPASRMPGRTVQSSAYLNVCLGPARGRRVGWLREFSPCSLGGPPNDPAARNDNNAQYNPPIKTGRDTGSNHKHRNDHREVIRTGVATVGASAPPCIQNARRCHQDKSNGPDGGSNRYRNGQSSKNSGLWNPPCQQIDACVAQPVTRGLIRSVNHSLSRATGSGSRLAGALALNRRTRH